MIKVRIKKQAKAKTGYQVDGALVNDIPAMGGGDFNRNISQPKLMESRYITADPREESNIEAEGGEIVYGDINGDFLPEAQIIKGPRHAQGGVPLNLPEDTFIFSDTRSMRIKDCEILQMFNKPCGKKSYTPAELAKQFDIQKYRVILEDPDSNKIERKTAELMIKNYIIKLGCLALKQESMKGFPQGIPVVGRPCMEKKGISEEDILPSKELAVLKENLEKLKSQEQDRSNQSPANQAVELNEGRPIAQPQPMQQPPQPMQPAPPQPSMQYGGGYSDIYKQQMQQQQAAQQQMIQLGKQVQAALQQGAAPEQVIQALLYDQVPPETIVGIFTQLGASQEEVVGLIEQTMAAAQQQQQLPMAQYGEQIGKDIEINEADFEGNPEGLQEALRRAYAQVGRTGKIYVRRKDGARYLQNVTPTLHEEYSGSDLGTYWNNNTKVAATYEAISQTLNDPATQEILGNYMRDALRLKDNYKRKTTYKPDGTPNPDHYWDFYEDEFGENLDDISNADLVKMYDNMQKRNLGTAAMGPKVYASLSPSSSGKEYPFGSWLYTDRKGEVRRKYSTGDGKKDNEGFVDIVMRTHPHITKSEAEEMYKAVSNNYPSLAKVSESLGIPMDTKDEFKREAYIQQAGFIAADKLMKDLDSDPGKFTEDQRYSLLGLTSFPSFKPYGQQVGFDDETTGIGGGLQISPIDGIYTNTSQGEIQAHHGLKFTDFDVENCQCDDPEGPNYSSILDAEGNCTCDPQVQLKDCPCYYPDGREVMMTPNANGECPPCQEDVDIEVPGYAPWWLQDTIKTTGAFGDLMRVKKYMPWAPGVDLEEPRPTFLDPTRELAANAEQANIQTQGMAQFAGSQALSARSTGIQGQAAKNAADILSKYNNANVNIANQFELKATDLRNQERMLQQATNQRVYDQTTVANQQFDNTKLAMRNNLRNYFTNAITNRWKTDALNQMYPDYAVDPSVGGQMYHTPNYRKPTPSQSGVMTQQEALDWCKRNDQNTSTSQCVQRMMNISKGMASQSSVQPDINAFYPTTNTFKYGGVIKPSTGYTYYNPWFDDDM